LNPQHQTQYQQVQNGTLVSFYDEFLLMSDSSLPELTLLETRVLGVLAEKQRTVPDIYPLTLNALVAGCNQKSSRDPVINASMAEVRTAINSLIQKDLVSEIGGGRADRFAHHMERVLKIPSQSAALMTTLMLRGPQTVGELRINSERLHKFADISSVESFLEELAERSDGSLVVKLPRQPGSRENRWMHLLSGTPEINQTEQTELARIFPQSGNIHSDYDLEALKSRVSHLETEIADLKKVIDTLSAQLSDSADQ